MGNAAPLNGAVSKSSRKVGALQELSLLGSFSTFWRTASLIDLERYCKPLEATCCVPSCASAVTTIEVCQMTAACDQQYLELAERILQEHILLHCVPYLPLLGRL